MNDRQRLCIASLEPPDQLCEHQVDFVGSKPVGRVAINGVTPELSHSSRSFLRQGQNDGRMQLKGRKVMFCSDLLLGVLSSWVTPSPRSLVTPPVSLP